MRIRLTVILSGRAIEELELPGFHLVRIGRSPGCELRLDNLGVSRRHAEIQNEHDVPVLYDCSGGRTLHNGAPVRRQALNDGDVLGIGKFTIGVALPDQFRTVAPAPDRSATPEAELTLAAGPRAAVVAQEAVDVQGYLTDPTGREAGPILLDRPYYLFGAGEGVDFEVPKGLLQPPLAAALVREDGGFRLLDLTARGDAVLVARRPTTDARLEHGDVFEVRQRRFGFYLGKPVGG